MRLLNVQPTKKKNVNYECNIKSLILFLSNPATQTKKKETVCVTMKNIPMKKEH